MRSLLRRVPAESRLDAEFEASARRGVIPADRGLSDIEQVAAVAQGRKPATIFDTRNVDGDPSIALALRHGLVVVVGAVNSRGKQTVIAGRGRAEVDAVIRAETMPWSLERNVAFGRALGYSADDINAFVKEQVGGRPTPQKVAHHNAWSAYYQREATAIGERVEPRYVQLTAPAPPRPQSPGLAG